MLAKPDWTFYIHTYTIFSIIYLDFIVYYQWLLELLNGFHYCFNSSLYSLEYVCMYMAQIKLIIKIDTFIMTKD